MGITLTDIARHAGCSPATVSRALNGTAGVKPKLRGRILAAVKELGSGGGVGQGGRGRPRGSLGKSDTVDVIVFRREPVEPVFVSNAGLTVAPMTDADPNSFFAPRFRLTTDFYRHIIEGIISVLSVGALKTVQHVRCDLLEAAFLHELRTARRRGVLLLGEPDPCVRAFIERCGRPVVLVDILGVPDCPVVTTDNAGGMARALAHLRALGHRDIAFAGHPDNPSFRERRHAYFGGLADAGLAIRPEWLYLGLGHVCDVTAGVIPILKRQARPSAFLCASDHYAMGVLQAAQALGLAVPRDLSVVGFDDIDAAPLLTPPLTTVRVPKIQIGACAADLLLRGTNGNGLDEAWHHCEVRCMPELAVRASTASYANRSSHQARRAGRARVCAQRTTGGAGCSEEF